MGRDGSAVARFLRRLKLRLYMNEKHDQGEFNVTAHSTPTTQLKLVCFLDDHCPEIGGNLGLWVQPGEINSCNPSMSVSRSSARLTINLPQNNLRSGWEVTVHNHPAS